MINQELTILHIFRDNISDFGPAYEQVDPVWIGGDRRDRLDVVYLWGGGRGQRSREVAAAQLVDGQAVAAAVGGLDGTAMKRGECNIPASILTVGSSPPIVAAGGRRLQTLTAEFGRVQKRNRC